MESKELKVGDLAEVLHTDYDDSFPVGAVWPVVDVFKGGVALADAEFPEGLNFFYDEVRPAELPNIPPDSKDTNPKDAIGSTKLGMDVVPDTAKAYMALAFTEGALKYGKFNWRVAGVRASIYKAALERHLAKYWNGEWADPKTGVPHLASVMACAAIIMDANAAKKLTDDRPPAIDMAGIIDGLEPAVAHLKDLFKDYSPHHHTEADKHQ